VYMEVNTHGAIVGVGSQQLGRQARGQRAERDV
jgi:hypothetical protein